MEARGGLGKGRGSRPSEKEVDEMQAAVSKLEVKKGRGKKERAEPYKTQRQRFQENPEVYIDSTRSSRRK